MSTTALYFTTGQTARELGVSASQLRSLCESRAIQAESTPGGHWRIPADELERLKRDGLPPIPRPLPNESTPARNGRGHHAAPELLAEPSDAAVSAAEDVAITRSRLEKRRIERDLEETEDWFRERDQRQAQEQTERDRDERARLAENARAEWLQQAEDYALRRVHPEVPAEMRLEALEAVRARLTPLAPEPGPKVTKEIVDAALEVALGPWIRLADLLAVAVEVRGSTLPLEIRYSADAAQWQKAATDAATNAMGELVGRDLRASLDALRAVATQSVQAVIDAFRQEQRCHKLMSDSSWLRLSDGTAEQREQARAAAEQALRELPVTASDRELQTARDTAIAPFHAAIAEDRAAQRNRAEAEARQVQERNYRNSLKQPHWLLLYDLSAAEREQAHTAIVQAIDALPEGVRSSEASAARALRPYLDRHAERKRQGKRDSQYLRGHGAIPSM